MDIAWYPYTTVNPSPRKPDGKLRLKPIAVDASTWQEAYTYVLIDNRVKYLEDPDGLRDYQETDMYLGLHDFDGDGTPELIFGDGISAAVFTFLEGQLMKIADICFPGTVWCVNGICFGGNSLAALCDGSGGSSFVMFGYIDGAWQLGRYTQLCDMAPSVNGRTATVEDIEKIHTTDWQILETDPMARLLPALLGRGRQKLRLSGGFQAFYLRRSNGLAQAERAQGFIRGYGKIQAFRYIFAHHPGIDTHYAARIFQN